MNPYKYSVSLIIQGDFDAEALKRSLGFEDAVAKNKGDKLGTTMQGEIVKHELSRIRKIFYREVEGNVVDAINDVCYQLESKGTNYTAVSQKDEVRLFVGVFGDKNFGFELDRNTLKRVEQLRVTLAFDIYPGDAASGAEGV
jgi:hypothetical protein